MDMTEVTKQRWAGLRRAVAFWVSPGQWRCPRTWLNFRLEQPAVAGGWGILSAGGVGSEGWRISVEAVCFEQAEERRGHERQDTDGEKVGLWKHVHRKPYAHEESLDRKGAWLFVCPHFCPWFCLELGRCSSWCCQIAAPVRKQGETVPESANNCVIMKITFWWPWWKTEKGVNVWWFSDFNYGEKNGLEIICSMLEFCGEELTDPSHKNSTVLYKHQNLFFFYGHTIQSHLYDRFYLLIYFWPCCLARGILVPRPGIKPVPSALEMHWVLTSRPPGKPLKETKLLTNFFNPVLCDFLSRWPQVPCPHFWVFALHCFLLACLFFTTLPQSSPMKIL